MADSDPPNVLVVTAHDVGRHLGCYGVDVRTPVLDSIADDGVVFENAFAASTTCAPSRASLDTGLLPHNHGMMGHPKVDPGPDQPWFGWEMDDDVATTPMYLGELGYTSYLCGLQHESTSVDRLGYDHVQRHASVDDPEKFGSHLSARALAEEVTGAIDREADREGPFYIQANAHNVHTPFSEREGGHREDPVPGFEAVGPDDVAVPAFLEGTAPVRDALVQVEEDLYELDYAIGQMLEALADNGLAEDTLVVFASDHGLPFAGGAKSTAFDDGIGISLLARLPGEIEAGRREDALVSNVDLLPTFLEMAGGRAPESLDGQSAWPLLSGVTEDHRDAVFTEMTWRWGGDPYMPIRAVRTQEYKYFRNFWPFDVGWKHFSAPIDGDPGEYYGVFENRRGIRPEEELYDLANDPHEEHNVIDDPAHEDTANRLRDRLRSKLEADDAPITRGHVPPVGFDTEF